MSTQRFVIDININGAGGQGTGRGQGEAGYGYFPIGDFSKRQFNLANKAETIAQRGINEYFGSNSGVYASGDPDMLKRTSQGFFKSQYSAGVYIFDQEKNYFTVSDINFSSFKGSKLDVHFTENKARYQALGAMVTRQTAAALIDHRQHTSGDAYVNAQLDNQMKLISYGALIAGSGPLAGFVAAGLVINEGISAISQVAKYNYDRKLERQQISNIQVVAGDISYGRNRGSL
ncbi:MAG: hypothetical protein GX896_02390 [Clostridiales bacterium]|nr:hypothetical protein [Clostridiales bacterium]